jgi:hypothetical protein
MAYEIAGKSKRGEEIIRQAVLDKQLEPLSYAFSNAKEWNGWRSRRSAIKSS